MILVRAWKGCSV